MQPREALFLSVRPAFAERLLGGTKTVELRRVRPDVQEGQLVLLYASSPTKALIGSAIVESVSTGSPGEIWVEFEKLAGVSGDEFGRYFAGAATAVAIRVREIKRLKVPIPLAEIRRRWPWLRPPQSFRFVQVDRMGETLSLAPRDRAIPVQRLSSVTTSRVTFDARFEGKTLSKLAKKKPR